MTQFKEKGGGSSGPLHLPRAAGGGHPACTAADAVPIGEDQRQHLELTRDLAERFNGRYGDTFTLPAAYAGRTRRADQGPAGPQSQDEQDDRRSRARVWVLDEPAVITKKVKSAVTDADREVRAGDDKPGITNLLTILSVATDRSVDALTEAYAGKGYGDFKADVAQAVVELFAPVRSRYAELVAAPDHLDAVLAAGAARAREVAVETMAAVRERVGLLAPR